MATASLLFFSSCSVVTCLRLLYIESTDLYNPVILLVVIVSYALSYLLGNVLKAGGGIGGLVEMLVALVMSYGLTYFFSERNRYFIIRGTVIFFVSLIILIILIFV